MTTTVACTLTELVGLSDPGSDAGRCYLCGRDTDRGHREPPSDAFTAWATVYSGSVLCERCYPVLHDRRFRARSWLATAAGVRFTEPGEDRRWLLETLLDPPEPPFALYLTRAGKKQGWISLVRYVSTSRERYWVGTDWLDRPVNLCRSWVHAVAPLVGELRRRRVPRTALVTGVFPPAVWKRAYREGWTRDLERAARLAGDPRWEVIVHVTPGSDTARQAD